MYYVYFLVSNFDKIVWFLFFLFNVVLSSMFKVCDVNNDKNVNNKNEEIEV